MKKKKMAIIVGSVLLTGVVSAAAAPPVIVSIASQQIADQGNNIPNLEDTINKVLNDDPKFIAIVPRLKLTETYVTTDTVGYFKSTISDESPVMKDFLLGLPGVQSVLNGLKSRDESDAHMVATKTHAKLEALGEARNVCYVIKHSTPTHIVVQSEDGKIELLNPENLPVYLDYCGGDAASYESALSKVVFKRDLAAEKAKIDAEVAAAH